jgi:hypothetical protein
MDWSVVAEFVGIVGQPTIVRLMSGPRPARTRVLAPLLLVGGRRLRRIARRLVRSLKLDHQLNQLVLAQPLQISAFHAHVVQSFASMARAAPSPVRSLKMGAGNYPKSLRVKVFPQNDRSRHAQHPPVRHVDSETARFGNPPL